MPAQTPRIPFGPELRVFVDTSALMEPGADKTFTWLGLELKKHRLKFLIPSSVIDELKNISGNRRSLADAGMMIVEQLQRDELLDIKGEPGDGYADNVFQAAFVRFRLKYSLLLITQDSRLAQDILNLNEANSVQKIRGVFSVRVSGGGIQTWELGNAGRALVSNPSPLTYTSHHLVLQSTALETVKSVPGIGDRVVSTDGKAHQLSKLLGTGGEGTAYLTDTGLVCKIYRADRLFRTRLDKLELMTQNPPNHRAVCWPTALVRGSEGRVGYLMSAARGRELQKCVFVKPLLVQHFPGWRKINLVQLAISILEPIAHLNSRDVILGDINPRNILVASDKEIYLVDTDSYQFMGHPCTVGMPPFLAPDLYGKQLDSMLRTPKHEAFAVSTLVFMLMLPGKPPYSHQGGADPAKNVKAGKFPYAVGDRKGKSVPEGPWRFQWSHLPRYLKEEFHHVFTDANPLGAAGWLEVLGRYRSDLLRGNVSNELFPAALKELNQAQTLKAGGRWIPCSSCGKEFGIFESHPIAFCNSCKARRAAEKAAREVSAGSPVLLPPAPSPGPLPSSRQAPSPSSAPTSQPASSPPSGPDDPLTAMIKWISGLFS